MTARPRRRPAPAVLPVVVLPAVFLLGAGCSAGPQAATSPAPSASASPVAGGMSLRELQLVHGPANFWLPQGTTVTSRIDQPNVVTLTFAPDARATLASWLRSRLPARGWVIQADRNDSLVFHTAEGSSPAWEGAFTCSTEVCALTLRHTG